MGRFSWKLIFLGGLALYVTQWIVSFATGTLIHEGVLEPYYQQTEAFWRPELMQEPPDMAALMPRWLITGLLAAFVTAAVYGVVRPALTGAGWKKGAQYGLIVVAITACWSAGWSGIFNLPDAIWLWWTVESFAYFIVGGIVLGWVGGKLAPEAAGA